MIELTTDYLLDADKYEWRLVRHRGTYVDAKDGRIKDKYEVLGHYATVTQAVTAGMNALLSETVSSGVITDLSRLTEVAEEYALIVKGKLRSFND
ncbi:hypothetical protein [Faecalibaculum rodentium]|uniref:hypothetical protein n=1 Tax=Faecalibaculum rodentium TaxID=1702221 RepID=UPI002729C170|nr:hypothetical protein [Faecalibaculum rodentium]